MKFLVSDADPKTVSRGEYLTKETYTSPEIVEKKKKKNRHEVLNQGRETVREVNTCSMVGEKGGLF